MTVVSSDAGDGATALLRTGIGQVATLVETIQSTALEISATSGEVSQASWTPSAPPRRSPAP